MRVNGVDRGPVESGAGEVQADLLNLKRSLRKNAINMNQFSLTDVDPRPALCRNHQIFEFV